LDIENEISILCRRERDNSSQKSMVRGKGVGA